MKPWFMNEGDVVPFPKKDDKILKLPNVGQYPDFLTGVEDLQARVKQGELSDEMYKKLYTELLHRFMRRESAETPWFMVEATPQDIQTLAKRVASLPADVSDRIIDKIASAIEVASGSKDASSSQYVKVAKSLQNIDDEDMKKHYKIVAKFMLGNGLTSLEINNIIKSINDNSAINLEQLKQPTNILSNIIKKELQGSPELNHYWLDMLNYQPAQGIGPGEILFATHSRELKKGTKGDLLIIDTDTPIEVKGGLYKGRFKDDDISPTPTYKKLATDFIKKYEQYIDIPPSGVNYTKLVDAIHNKQIPVKVRNQMYKDFETTIKNLFPNNPYTGTVLDSVKGNDSKSALNAHAMANLDAYFKAKQAEGGMGILFIDRRKGSTKTSYAENLTSLLKGFNLSVETAYPISTVERNPFAQMGVVQK